MGTEAGTKFLRIVTGRNDRNQAVIASAAPPTRIYDDLGGAGFVFYEVWNTRETPARIDRNDNEPHEERLTLPPPAQGTRIRVVDVPPDDPLQDFDEIHERTGAKDNRIDRPDRPHASFHCTRSIDYGIVLSGEITLLLDAGEVTISAGDIVVQRGTSHGWVNRSDRPCRVAFVLVDGIFDEDLA